jgi:thioredoxin-dependent peroxiredoxin|tara:strand:+ start:6394 stop:6882 length:489 start_codon:yes stop_codon:yes gene_type:complete
MHTVQLNQPVPEFTCSTTADEALTLAQLKGKNVVIYFYPKDNTPGCTQEGQDFRDNYTAFQQANTLIFGVSRDSLRTHNNFKTKFSFPFDLISDPDETVCQLFEVIKPKKLYGKEYIGIERSTFLIDAHGVLIQEWRKVRVKGHVAEVLAAAETLTKSDSND